MLGPNGVGKSTIFNLITGLINPSNGKIKIDGEEVNEYPIYLRAKKFKIGYVPQYGGYFHDLTLRENLIAIAEIQIDDIKKRKIKIDYFVLGYISGTGCTHDIACFGLSSPKLPSIL